MRLEWNKGDKVIDICWCPKLKALSYTKLKTEANKYVDNTYSVTRNIGRLSITYTNWEYNKICHVLLRSDKLFKNSPCAVEVKALQETLKWLSTLPDDYRQQINTPFSFAVETNFDENGKEYQIYYITVKKSWLVKNNLQCIADPLLVALNRNELIAAENKFPKYSKYKKEIIYI